MYKISIAGPLLLCMMPLCAAMEMGKGYNSNDESTESEFDENAPYYQEEMDTILQKYWQPDQNTYSHELITAITKFDVNAVKNVLATNVSKEVLADGLSLAATYEHPQHYILILLSSALWHKWETSKWNETNSAPNSDDDDVTLYPTPDDGKQCEDNADIDTMVYAMQFMSVATVATAMNGKRKYG